MDKKVINADEAKKSSFEELLKKLSSDKGGISSSEAQKRLQEYGPNEISEKKLILSLSSLNISGDQCHGL
ncbi:MAG TPA: cation-transporting P-type ATPase [Methanobacterium sp.]|nr:cation-transporting P-type ATPase [Methanobacterium sp.]